MKTKSTLKRITWDLERQRTDAFGLVYHRLVTLDPQERTIAVMDQHRDVNGTPFDVYNGVNIRFGAKGLTKSNVECVIRQYDDLIERIIAGHSIRWNGNNYVGTLTDDAAEASWKLQERFDVARYE